MPYLYTGTGTRPYMDYLDESTGRMLEAVPGWQGEMRANDPRLPVPPADGFWEVVEEAVAAEVPEAAPPAEASPKGHRPAKTSA